LLWSQPVKRLLLCPFLSGNGRKGLFYADRSLADSILPLPVISDFDFPQEIQNHKEITEMKKRYFIRKTDSTEKERPEWIELNGAEFYAFTADPANKDRFIILGGEGCEETETLYLEVDEKEYSK
jgi:hypothetical protein